MSWDEYLQRCKVISERLDYIADRTANMAMLGIAVPTNPLFRDLMRAQETLLRAADALIDEFESKSKE